MSDRIAIIRAIAAGAFVGTFGVLIGADHWLGAAMLFAGWVFGCIAAAPAPDEARK